MVDNNSYKIILPSLAIIILGELFVFQGRAFEGVGLHVLNLLALAILTILIKDKLRVEVVQAFLLVSLFRIVDTSMPAFFTLTLYWYPLIYTPMFISIFILLRYQAPSLEEIGLTYKYLYIYLPIGVLFGLVFAWFEYQIIRPCSLIPNLSISNIFVLAIIMLMFVGVVEELIFRSILQTKLESVVGPYESLFLTSVIFGVMHSSFGSLSEIAFGIAAGALIGFIFQRTRSLPFIATIHGVTNIFLFGIIPFFL
jgi:membrane protease YdiL (CAAX protease family)